MQISVVCVRRFAVPAKPVVVIWTAWKTAPTRAAGVPRLAMRWQQIVDLKGAKSMARSHRLATVLLALVAVAGCQQAEPNADGDRAAPPTASSGASADGSVRREMTTSASLPADANPAARGYASAMDKMNREMMALPMSGNADRDFMMMMKTHHQAAIDMAEVERAHGRNEQARTMAQQVITEQQAEIAEIDRWLAENR